MVILDLLAQHLWRQRKKALLFCFLNFNFGENGVLPPRGCYELVFNVFGITSFFQSIYTMDNWELNWEKKSKWFMRFSVFGCFAPEFQTFWIVFGARKTCWLFIDWFLFSAPWEVTYGRESESNRTKWIELINSVCSFLLAILDVHWVFFPS